ncbi:hypothetical protein P8452_09138 [Trifolium repens]|nr:hypothetical protein P8452_09138 [Trifolium repens]
MLFSVFVNKDSGSFRKIIDSYIINRDLLTNFACQSKNIYNQSFKIVCSMIGLRFCSPSVMLFSVLKVPISPGFVADEYEAAVIEMYAKEEKKTHV